MNRTMMVEEALANLRQDIMLDSLFIADYENRYDISANDVCTFFDGYTEDLYYFMQADFGEDVNYYDHINDYDNIITLTEYYYDCVVGGFDILESLNIYDNTDTCEDYRLAA